MPRQTVAFFILFLVTGIFTGYGQTKNTPPTQSVKKEPVLSLDKNALKFFSEGNKFLAANQPARAIPSYRLALKSDSLFTAAMDSIAFCYKSSGRTDSAEFYYKRSFRVQPTNVYAMANLAMIYVSRNDIVKAEGIYNRIIKTDAQDPDGYFGLAEIMLKTGRYNKAVANSLKAYNLWKVKFPRYAGDALFYAGIGSLSKGDTLNARKYFERSRKLGTVIPADYLKKAGMGK